MYQKRRTINIVGRLLIERNTLMDSTTCYTTIQTTYSTVSGRDVTGVANSVVMVSPLFQDDHVDMVENGLGVHPPLLGHTEPAT